MPKRKQQTVSERKNLKRKKYCYYGLSLVSLMICCFLGGFCIKGINSETNYKPEEINDINQDIADWNSTHLPEIKSWNVEIRTTNQNSESESLVLEKNEELDDEIELEIEPYEEYNLVGENDSDVVLKNSIEMLQVDYLSHSNGLVYKNAIMSKIEVVIEKEEEEESSLESILLPIFIDRIWNPRKSHCEDSGAFYIQETKDCKITYSLQRFTLLINHQFQIVQFNKTLKCYDDEDHCLVYQQIPWHSVDPPQLSDLNSTITINLRQEKDPFVLYINYQSHVKSYSVLILCIIGLVLALILLIAPVLFFIQGVNVRDDERKLEVKRLRYEMH